MSGFPLIHFFAICRDLQHFFERILKLKQNRRFILCPTCFADSFYRIKNGLLQEEFAIFYELAALRVVKLYQYLSPEFSKLGGALNS